MAGALSGLYGGRGLTPVRGEGIFLWDSEGRRYIDFFNGHGAALFGHSEPVLLEALKRGAEGIWSCGAGYDSPAREELASLLGERLGKGRVFLCNSGTEAVEAALKLAVALNGGRREILACRRGFHGRSCGALGLTFNPKYRSAFSSLIPAVRHCAPEELPQRISSDTAVVFIEPVQGEGGVLPIAPEIGAAVTESCHAAGALLVADEVQTGLGRCGSFFASGGSGLTPDIICLAKGLAGGMAAGAVVWREELGDFPPHSHGSTYGGNGLAAAVSVAALKLIEERKLCEKAERTGNRIRRLLAEKTLPGVKAIRGRGLLIGVETELPSLEIVKSLQEHGLLSLAAGPRTVRFLPSFAVTEEAAEQAVQIFEETMKELMR